MITSHFFSAPSAGSASPVGLVRVQRTVAPSAIVGAIAPVTTAVNEPHLWAGSAAAAVAIKVAHLEAPVRGDVVVPRVALHHLHREAVLGVLGSGVIHVDEAPVRR